MKVSSFITSILKSPVILAIWLAFIGVVYSQIVIFFFALNCIFFLANRKAILNHLTTTNQITWKLVKAFATFKNLELSTGSIKYLYRLKILYPTDCRVLWPQNGCDKVVIGLHAKQLWSKIILVITNQTCASVFRFEITHMISDQIAQNEVQLNHY